MESLAKQTCEACRADAPRVNEAESADMLRELPGWDVIHVDGVPRLQKSYDFPDFQKAIDFANRVGAAAEAENHHPQLVVEWGRTTVAWWTHKIRGLHRNDFIMAARTDQLAAGD